MDKVSREQTWDALGKKAFVPPWKGRCEGRIRGGTISE
jgi:hypothetical protein